MKKLFVLTVMVTVSVCLPASAAIIYVPGQYSTIQEGINASSNGDTVLVQPGTYYENINFNGHNILLCSMFLPTNDTTYTSSTIIDGSNSSSTVKFAGGEDSTAIICGFTIQHGYNDYGGGIRCIVSSPAIKNNIIRRNRSFGGGGIYCDRSNPLIVNNVIYEDTANYGGGIFCYDSSSPLIDNNTIKYNYSDGLNYGSGAGICCMTNSHPTISKNKIIINTI